MSPMTCKEYQETDEKNYTSKMLICIVRSANLLIWDANSSRSNWLDTGIRDPLNVLIWSKTGPTLAIGSYRGNLMIYNHKTSRKVPVIAKHSKAITCGAWSTGNLLALGSEDRTLSISGDKGKQ